MRKENKNPPIGMPERIRSLVLESDKSIVETAKILGLNRSRLYDYMNGVCTPNATVIAKICVYFNVSADWLILGRGE